MYTFEYVIQVLPGLPLLHYFIRDAKHQKDSQVAMKQLQTKASRERYALQGARIMISSIRIVAKGPCYNKKLAGDISDME